MSKYSSFLDFTKIPSLQSNIYDTPNMASTAKKKKSFTSKNWYLKNPGSVLYPSYALLRTHKRYLYF